MSGAGSTGRRSGTAATPARAPPRPPPGSAELAELWRPWIGTCIELFGAERCLFESNFPVDRMGTGWVALWNAFKRIAEKGSAFEKDCLFRRTAAVTYGIELEDDLSAA